jgi:hypothetical protein
MPCVECGAECGDVMCANCMGDEDEARRSDEAAKVTDDPEI